MIQTLNGALSSSKWAISLLFALSWHPAYSLLDETVVSAGSHTCLLMKDHRFKCWGRNYHGELGLGYTGSVGDQENEMSTNLPFVDLGDNVSPPIQIAASNEFTCSLSIDGEIKCWGYYSKWLGTEYAPRTGPHNGAVANNPSAKDAVAYDLGLGDDFHAIQLAARNLYICALSMQQTVKCFGTKYPEFVGAIDASLQTLDFGVNQPVVMLEAGGYHTCAVFADKTSVKCWGYTFAADALEEGADYDDPINFGLVDFGEDFVIKQIVGGYKHSCALSEDYRVKCWGRNVEGALGYGMINDPSGLEYLSHPNTNEWTVDLGSNFVPVAISSKSQHTCALSDNQEVKCWGINDYGQLGVSDKVTRGDGPNQMGDNLDAIDFGADFVPIKIIVGNAHSCAMAEGDRLRCWGRNEEGELGYEDTKSRGVSKKKRVSKLVDISYD